MPRTPEDIIALWHERRMADGPLISAMNELRRLYNGEIDVVLPEMDSREKPMVGDIVAQGLDQLAQRVASTVPDIQCPALKPGFPRSEEYARIRRQAMFAWWRMNDIQMKNRRRARWLIGYGIAPVILRPDFKKRLPRWEPRDPLTTYPAPTQDPDEITPPDCIFTYQRPWWWIRRRYPEAAFALTRPSNAGGDTLFDLVEYVDDEQHTVLAVGKGGIGMGMVGEQTAVVLESVPNRAGIPLAVVPARITLDRRHGQFSKSVGIFMNQAKLMALAMIATYKGVFPDLAAFSGDPSRFPEILGGIWKDGRSGEINLVKGGQVQAIQTNPGFMTNPMIDRLESYVRESAGVPSELQGEAPTNVRTGRRAAHLLSSVIDFPVQEYQEIMAASAREELRRGIAIDKAYFDAPKSFYVSGFKGAKGKVDYEPGKHFEHDEVEVSYSQAGADVNSLTVGLGQVVGLGLMSKKRGRKLHPMIDDPEREDDEVTAEALEMALLASIQQQASSGAIPPSDVARIAQLIRENRGNLAEAVMVAQREAQERQATQVPQGAPEAQPGLAVPGAGAEAGTGNFPEAPGGIDQLESLLLTLARPAQAARRV